MRATTFISGLVLTSAVLALPAPRPSDITDDNPFTNGRRQVEQIESELTGITSELGLDTSKIARRAVPSAIVTGTSVTDGVTGVTKELGLDLPVRRQSLDPITAPVNQELNAITSDAGIQLPPIVVRQSVPSLAGVENVPNKAVEYIENEAGLKNLPQVGARQVSGVDTTTVTETVGEVTNELETTTGGLGLNLPRQVNAVTSTVSEVEAEVEGTTSGLGLNLPRQVGTVTTTVSEVEGELTSTTGSLGLNLPRGLTSDVTDTVSPLVSLATNLLSGALSSFTSMDAQVTSITSHAEDNTSDLAATLTSEMNTAAGDVTKAVNALRSAGSDVSDVSVQMKQIETTAQTLIADLEKVGGSGPVGDAVPSLVSEARTVIATIQGLGL